MVTYKVYEDSLTSGNVEIDIASDLSKKAKVVILSSNVDVSVNLALATNGAEDQDYGETFTLYAGKDLTFTNTGVIKVKLTKKVSNVNYRILAL
jgi:hypothetical protein